MRERPRQTELGDTVLRRQPMNQSDRILQTVDNDAKRQVDLGLMSLLTLVALAQQQWTEGKHDDLVSTLKRIHQVVMHINDALWWFRKVRRANLYDDP